MAHTGIEMDEEVWLTQQGVIDGKDDVVEAAIEWINNASSVKNNENEIIKDYRLVQNFPNPFNPNTVISYQLPVSGDATLKVYDVLGNEVVTLVDEYKQAGSYEVEFNPASSIKNPASGIYFYQLRAGSFVQTKKMILLR
jgi:hypothetical protein